MNAIERQRTPWGFGVFTLVVVAIFIGEALTPRVVIAGSIILAAVALIVVARNRAAAASTRTAAPA